VIPELASRLHQQQVVRVVQAALAAADVQASELSAVAFTAGPGLLGALLVGVSFAKTFAYGLGIPSIEVNHMEAHVLANFVAKRDAEDTPPAFPFLCLTVSGGHTQLVLVHAPLQMEIIGETIDDAAGEAFDKAAKLLGLPYPGGPQVDAMAQRGDASRFKFPTPDVGAFSFSFSGLKTSLLYQVRDGVARNPAFIAENTAHLCAAYQDKIVSILLDKVAHAATVHGVRDVAIAGGVSANAELRKRFRILCEKRGWRAHIPAFEFCTDNAAMIGIVGYYKLQARKFAALDVAPFTRA
jgi:N6-L-threonylcarbamoyladenine synthase